MMAARKRHHQVLRDEFVYLTTKANLDITTIRRVLRYSRMLRMGSGGDMVGRLTQLAKEANLKIVIKGMDVTAYLAGPSGDISIQVPVHITSWERKRRAKVV